MRGVRHLQVLPYFIMRFDTSAAGTILIIMLCLSFVLLQRNI